MLIIHQQKAFLHDRTPSIGWWRRTRTAGIRNSDAAGHAVDLKPSKWRLNSASSRNTLINWEKLIGCDDHAGAALRAHVIRLIETRGTEYVGNAFEAISMFLRNLRDGNSAPDRSVTLSGLMWYLERLRVSREDRKLILKKLSKN